MKESYVMHPNSLVENPELTHRTELKSLLWAQEDSEYKETPR